MQTCTCNAAPHVNAAPRVQRSPTYATQPRMPDAAPRVQCGHAKRLCLATGSATVKPLAARHPLSVKIGPAPVAVEPSAPRRCIAVASLGGGESKHGVGAQGDGAADAHHAACLRESLCTFTFFGSLFAAFVSPPALRCHHPPFSFPPKKFQARPLASPKGR